MPDDTANVPFVRLEDRGWTIIEFKTESLMESSFLERIGQALFPIVDVEHKHRMVLDFTSVQYLSSQALGVLLGLHKKISVQPHGQLVLCGVSDKLMMLLKMVKLDRLLAVKPTQRDAINTPQT